MDRDRFHHLETLFDAAADVAPSERESFLRTSCGDDPEMTAELRRLLAQLDRPLAIDGAPTAGGTSDVFAAPGTVIGRFVLREAIGEGGFGLVYRAEQQEPLRREVALKILKPGMDSRRVLARFESERQALARMNHPHIARVLEAGEDDQGRPYFVMDLVEGVTITTFCGDHSLGLRGRLDLFLQVCDAVHHAHQKGIIHRDLKPSNVLVTDRDGAPSCRVIDFGIAKAMNAAPDDVGGITRDDQLVGTPAYMSPEQAAGGVDVDTRADIYALGVLLYELLTGTTPHEELDLGHRSSQDIRRLIEECDPPKPSTRIARGADRSSLPAGAEALARRRAVRGDLDWIVMKAIEKDPQRRYETAERLADDVRRHLHDEPVLASPPSLRYRIGKFARRHRIGVAAGTLVALALLVGGALSTAGFVSASRARDRALDRLYESLVGQARIVRQRGDRGWRTESLGLIDQAASIRTTPELRNEAIASLCMTDLELVRRLPLEQAPGARATTLGLDDHDRFAVAGPERSVVVRSLPAGDVMARLRGPQEMPWVLVFSPAGRYLAVKHHEGSTVHLVVWEVARERPALSLMNIPNMLGCIEFAADETWIAVGDPSGHVSRYDLATSTLVNRIDVGGPPLSISLSRRDETLAVAVAGETSVRFHDVERGAVTRTVETFEPVVEIRCSRDGTRMATATAAGLLSVWDLDAGRLLATLRGHQGRPRLLEFSDDATRLASTAWDATARLWNIEAQRPASEPFRGDSLVGFGEELLLEDRTALSVWRETRSPVLRSISVRGDVGENPQVEIAPDGRLCVVGADDGVRVLDLHAGVEIGHLAPDVDCYSLVFTPDGGRLIGGTEDGLLVWSIESSGDTVAIGAPRRVLQSGPFTRAGVAADGRRALVCGPSRMQLVDLDDPDKRELVAEQPLWACRPSASSDARWYFTGAWRNPPARVWDAERREVVLEFKGTSVGGRFGPHSRWLAVANGPQYRFIEAGTWIERWQFERATGSMHAGPVTFDASGAIAAIALTLDTVSLVDLGTGRILAELPGASGERLVSLAFTPDGATLVAGARALGPLQVWDLRALRGELGRLGLDWDLRPLPAPAARDGELPLRVVPGPRDTSAAR